GSDRVRVLGTGHSFNEIADTDGVLVSIEDLPKVLDIDAERGSVRVSGGIRYGELTGFLEANGLALANLGSLPHISVAGACATGTHGSGDRNSILAAAVSGLTLVTADGTLIELSRADKDFPGAVVGLGSLGVVIELTLDVLPSYQLYQYVYDDLPVRTLCENFDELTGSAYSVSMFTRWQADRIDQVWLKSLEPRPAGEALFGALPAALARHPVGGDPSFATQQLGVGGPWQQRLPHFRLEFTPSSGAEIQSEYFVAREHAVPAIQAVSGLAELLAPVLQIAEIRTVAADELWISPCYQQDRVALHFTWILDQARVEPVVAELERRLADFQAVPHWAKLFLIEPEPLAALHPRLAEFANLVRRYDPTGTFANAFTHRYLPAG
ncbi:MAG: FAD-binding protein, partial [Actinomycetota bacterium]|nr:FAD-binding protein [Actinomycetota bacterium]